MHAEKDGYSSSKMSGTFAKKVPLCCVYAVVSQLHNEADHARFRFDCTDAAFVPSGDGLRDREPDAEARTSCPGGVLAVEPVEQPVEPDAVHALAGVRDGEHGALFLPELRMDAAAWVAVLHGIVEQNRRKLPDLGFIAAIADARVDIRRQLLAAHRGQLCKFIDRLTDSRRTGMSAGGQQERQQELLEHNKGYRLKKERSNSA